MSSGTVEAADACSESSIELSSIGKVTGKANSTGTGSVKVSREQVEDLPRFGSVRSD